MTSDEGSDWGQVWVCIALLVMSRGNFGALWGIRFKTNAHPNEFTLQEKAGILWHPNIEVFFKEFCVN